MTSTYAGMAFKRATEYDPDMCDAWLGRAAAGENTAEVVHHLYRTSKTLGREQRRLGSAARAHSAGASRPAFIWTTA